MRVAAFARPALWAVASVLVAAPAAAQDKTIDKDFVRRALLDNCVYTMVSREGVNRNSMIEACQCASTRAAKEIRDEDLQGLSERSRIPDAWVRAVQASFPQCGR